MQQITGFNDEYKQDITISLNNGETAQFHFEYLENQQGWFFSFEYGEKRAGIYQLTNCPNILREFQNTLPFGIGCYVTDGGEPFLLNDLTSGRVILVLLDSDDVRLVGQQIYGKIW